MGNKTGNVTRIRDIFKYAVLVLMFNLLVASAANAVELSPRTNDGSGVLPSDFMSITFQVSNGNFVRDISLPASPQNDATVTIVSDAGFFANIDTRFTDYPLDTLRLMTGDSYTFTYNARLGQWLIGGELVDRFVPRDFNSTGLIPDNPKLFTLYETFDGNWSRTITLPAQATSGDIITVRSNATFVSRILADNVVYASTLRVETGDSYSFRFSDEPRGWILIDAPTRSLRAGTLPGGRIPRLTAPHTEIYFSDGNYVRELLLPATNDRNRISLVTDATFPVTLNGSNIYDHESIRLTTGSRIELAYIADENLWHVVTPPEPDRLLARELVNGALPRNLTPHTIIRFYNGNWTRNVQLPNRGVPGTRVTIDTAATLPVNVNGLGSSSSESITVRTGELVSVKADQDGVWQRETITVDVLMLYSDEVVERIGRSAARARAFESFSLTNEALENSGANFRIRMVGLTNFDSPDEWETLGDVLREIRTNTQAQALRDGVNADFIYYEGTERGCGLAYVRSSSFNAIGSGALGCPTRVMRHEFGHNMGLAHGVLVGTDGRFARGYSVVGSIMGGNQIPFFSTPRRFTAEGIPMGIENQIDGVRAMNEFSMEASEHR